MAETNPIRYRGYYYDAETEFYYLQSRYYDPAICRFINGDGYASTGQGFLGQNMFSYCCNCPILFSDPAGRKVVIDLSSFSSEEISLTKREFNILYKLLSYPKKTFTRQQLMDEFWDADTDTAPRAVDVYMTKLRSKLADCVDFEIRTVHGLGYKAVVK